MHHLLLVVMIWHSKKEPSITECCSLVACCVGLLLPRVVVGRGRVGCWLMLLPLLLGASWAVPFVLPECHLTFL